MRCHSHRSGGGKLESADQLSANLIVAPLEDSHRDDAPETAQVTRTVWQPLVDHYLDRCIQVVDAKRAALDVIAHETDVVARAHSEQARGVQPGRWTREPGVVPKTRPSVA